MRNDVRGQGHKVNCSERCTSLTEVRQRFEGLAYFFDNYDRTLMNIHQFISKFDVFLPF